MLFGLSIGLAVALVVYLRSGNPALQGIAAPPAASRIREIQQEPAAPVATEREAEPVAADSAAADPEEPALFFYNGLRETEVIVDANEFDFGGRNDAPVRVLIQAGSFPDLHRADTRQADIALLGIESRIDPAVVNGEVYYRVNIGPLTERGDINRTRRMLRDQGIDTVMYELAN